MGDGIGEGEGDGLGDGEGDGAGDGEADTAGDGLMLGFGEAPGDTVGEITGEDGIIVGGAKVDAGGVVVVGRIGVRVGVLTGAWVVTAAGCATGLLTVGLVLA